MIKRIFAPVIITPDGVTHKMTIVESDGSGRPLKIYPFDGELHSTTYIGPRVKLTISKEGDLRVTRI